MFLCVSLRATAAGRMQSGLLLYSLQSQALTHMLVLPEMVGPPTPRSIQWRSTHSLTHWLWRAHTTARVQAC